MTCWGGLNRLLSVGPFSSENFPKPPTEPKANYYYRRIGTCPISRGSHHLPRRETQICITFGAHGVFSGTWEFPTWEFSRENRWRHQGGGCPPAIRHAANVHIRTRGNARKTNLYRPCQLSHVRHWEISHLGILLTLAETGGVKWLPLCHSQLPAARWRVLSYRADLRVTPSPVTRHNANTAIRSDA